MNHYEIMYLIPLQADTDGPSAVPEKVRAMLTAEGAKLTHEENLGKRKLAYPINHVRHGTYVVLECDVAPDKVKKIQDWFRLSPEILRAQIITKAVKTPEQLAREKAFQEKLARLHAAAAAPIARPAAEPAAAEHAPAKVKLDELDKKLEEILGEEVVK